MAHNSIIDIHGNLYMFGSNKLHQFGMKNNTSDVFNKPLRVLVPEKLIRSKCFDKNTVLLTEEGTILFFNTNGLNVVNNLPKIVDIKCGLYSCFGLDKNSNLWMINYQDPNSSKMMNTFFKVSDFDCGISHIVLITTDGSILFFKYSNISLISGFENAQLRKLDFDTKISKVFCGDYHSILISGNGTTFSFGYNCSGQLGHGDKISRDYPTRLENTKNIVTASCGRFHTILIDYHGKAWSFGENKYGQLCLGTNLDVQTPTKIKTVSFIINSSCGISHTLLIDINGYVWSCGKNNLGQLGLSDNINRNLPQKIRFLRSTITR